MNNKSYDFYLHQILGSVWEFIREGKGREWNNNKGMERNGIDWDVFK